MTGCQCAAGLAKRDRQPFTPKASIKQPTDLTSRMSLGGRMRTWRKFMHAQGECAES